MLRMVVDTNVLVSAMLAPAGEPRSVLRLCLNGEVVPLVGNALFSEYETVFARSSLFANCLIDRCERKQLVDAFLACCEWIAISFLWRPNLADEADNHPVELAVAGNADWIVTANICHLRSGEMQFPGLRIGPAGQFMKEWRKTWPS